MRAALLLAAALPLMLAACASGGPPKPTKRQLAMIDRVLATAPGAAQPSTIVAAEIAFARDAQELGQWTAFAKYAAPGALLHGSKGPFEIAPWLATQSNPPQAVTWKARTVVMSCDGALAVSQGRSREPDGTVGSFVTVWERQPDGEYRYVFDVGGPDVPQPPPKPKIEAQPGDIVVTEIDAIQGLVATCPPGGGVIPTAPRLPMKNAAIHDSRDGTLRWGWAHKDDGTRYFLAEYYYEGRWLKGIEQSLVPPGN